MNLCLALASLLFLGPQNDTLSNEQFKKEFKGNVKVFKYYMSTIEESVGERLGVNPDSIDIKLVYVKIYNPSGQEIEWTQFLGSKTLKRILEFNKQGILSEKKEIINDTLNSRVVYKYNKDFKLIEEVGFDSKGKLISKTKRIYFENGKLSKRISESSFKFSYEYKYDSLWRSYDRINYNDDRVTRIERREYNEKGALIRSIDYNGNKELITKSEYLYDSLGREIAIWHYFNNGTYYLTQKKYSISDSCNIIETTFSTNGIISSKAVNRFDSCSRTGTIISYDSSGVKESEYRQRQDKNKNVIASVFIDSLNNLDFARFSEYNDKGDEILDISIYSTDNSTSTWRYVYEYDSKDNWIKKVSYRNGTLYLIEKREFEYFED